MAAPVAKLFIGVCLYGYLEWQEVQSRRKHNVRMERLNAIERNMEQAHKLNLQEREQDFQAEQSALYREQRERHHRH